MEAKLKARCTLSKERKRKRDQIEDALSVLRSISLQDLGNLEFSKSDDLIALLCVKFGWKTVFVLGRLLSILPRVICGNIEQRILEGSFPELEKMVTLDELHALNDVLRTCQDFIDFSYEKSVVAISANAKIPMHRILFPPTTTCFTCGWTLQMQSQPANVTVFEKDEPLPGIKFNLKCRNCNCHYGYSMYGNNDEGYRFYEKRRPYIESSNVTFVSRGLCLEHICLA